MCQWVAAFWARKPTAPLPVCSRSRAVGGGDGDGRIQVTLSSGCGQGHSRHGNIIKGR